MLARRCICCALVGRPSRRDLRGTSPCSGCRRSQSKTSSNNQRGCLVPGTLYAGGTRLGARHRSATSVARSRWSRCASPSRSRTGPIGDDVRGEPLNESGDCIGRTPSCSSRQAADGIAYKDASGAVALIAGCAPSRGHSCAVSRFPNRIKRTPTNVGARCPTVTVVHQGDRQSFVGVPVFTALSPSCHPEG